MGTLFVVATPIGNLEDISLRAIKTLFSVDYVACEDTRRTGLLLDELKKRYPSIVPKDSPSEGLSLNTQGHSRLVQYYDEIEDKRLPEVIDILTQGRSVALVSDAGTPLISDPGYVLIKEARKRGIPVISIPGASALLTALTSSGLPADKFMFLGYPPEKQGNRLKLFEHISSMNRFIESTYIFYSAPHKLQSTLEDMKNSFGDIEIVICRELTKIHEEYWRGAVSAAISRFIQPKGEFVLLIRLE